jgi:hypothetical protein
MTPLDTIPISTISVAKKKDNGQLPRCLQSLALAEALKGPQTWAFPSK